MDSTASKKSLHSFLTEYSNKKECIIRHNNKWVTTETLYPWLAKMRSVKIQIRLRECAVWSESSLSAHDRRCAFWLCGSNDQMTPTMRMCKMIWIYAIRVCMFFVVFFLLGASRMGMYSACHLSIKANNGLATGARRVFKLPIYNK